ncbi:MULTISPECIES: hypothetical protein [Brucellaceae]|uniref:Uncharacterized protein n=1 Tax=Pseudochrobactrum saccharolyticum TaxID=354352 RepID=A0A7W8AM99_9HYPH|nr:MULTISPECIES: hypothetical protein [Brucellaceae]MBX8811218.1 hypothetical protein [Ochrobactrum sp. MR34]KAB0538456.1 hypothetical protein F7P81_12235 [Pseudochrobactrum saccharolyticum]MBB5091733.1 hypothetical protein [Pseudochrobactrum saccharolyticum]MBX8824769.1 hypothetical protein [Ochrobactrum sp. SFR4]MDP8249300.1 hypothetical protein [Pseudochrobactrum saccharolyticum]
MGNWKTNYRVSDLSDTQKLEMICKKCSRLVYINKATICTAKGREQLYLDEIEKRARCKARGCKGQMRMAMVRQDEMSGFTGGLA